MLKKRGDPLNEEINVGSKLKRLRTLRKISLTRIAEETGMSYSYLSGLENNKHSISIANLQRLSEYFQVDLIYFLKTTGDHDSVYIPAGQSRKTVTEDNVNFSFIVNRKDSRLQVTLVEMPKDSPSERHIHHHREGEEFISLLSGQLHVIVGDEEYVMDAGDAVLFRSEVDHVIYTKDQPAKFLLVVTPPYGDIEGMKL